MISAGVEGRLPYMTYPDPYRGPPKQPPEFLRPAPKPLPTRYNGLTAPAPNGTRLGPLPPRTVTKYSSPPETAVNLTQHKEDVPDELYSVYSRLFPPSHTHFGPFTPNPYSNIYQYPPFSRASFNHPPPLSPLESYSPTTPTTFLSSPSNFSPPGKAPQHPQPSATIVRESKQQVVQQQPPFKVPSGKEGSLKHRILTRPEEGGGRGPLDLHQKSAERGRLTPPPRSPKGKSLNNNVAPGPFPKGAVILLSSGEYRKIEEMRTEDFVSCADQSPELRLADSTVVKLEENAANGTVTITLSYNQRRNKTEFDTTLDHPYFVYGQGWASCRPDRTLQHYGLTVHRLQVGDVIVAMTPRQTTSQPKKQPSHQLLPPPPPPRSSTIITTATTTAVTARQVSSAEAKRTSATSNGVEDMEMGSRKRRWSAPGEICDEEEQAAAAAARKHRSE